MGIVEIGHVERDTTSCRASGHFDRASSYARSTSWRFSVGRFALALVFAVMSLDRLGDRAPGWH